MAKLTEKEEIYRDALCSILWLDQNRVSSITDAHELAESALMKVDKLERKIGGWLK